MNLHVGMGTSPVGGHSCSGRASVTSLHSYGAGAGGAGHHSRMPSLATHGRVSSCCHQRSRDDRGATQRAILESVPDMMETIVLISYLHDIGIVVPAAPPPCGGSSECQSFMVPGWSWPPWDDIFLHSVQCHIIHSPHEMLITARIKAVQEDPAEHLNIRCCV